MELGREDCWWPAIQYLIDPHPVGRSVEIRIQVQKILSCHLPGGIAAPVCNSSVPEKDCVFSINNTDPYRQCIREFCKDRQVVLLVHDLSSLEISLTRWIRVSND